MSRSSAAAPARDVYTRVTSQISADLETTGATIANAALPDYM
jgi:hypothetical protein